jgi:hypothetical protein
MEEKIENRIYIYLNLISQIIILICLTRSFFYAYVLLTKTDFNNGFDIFWLSLYLISLVLAFAGLIKYILTRIKEPKYNFTNTEFTFNWIEHMASKIFSFKSMVDENLSSGILLYPFLMSFVFSYTLTDADGFFPEFNKQFFAKVSFGGALGNVAIFWFLIAHSRANLIFKEQFPLLYLYEENYTTSYSEFAYKNEFNEITRYKDLYLRLTSESLIDRKIYKGEMCKITILNHNKSEVGIYTSKSSFLLTSIKSVELIKLIEKQDAYNKFNAQIIRYWHNEVIIRFWIKNLTKE